MILTEHLDVLLLQETLGEGVEVENRLSLLLPDWSFITLDSIGRSGGLAIGWNCRTIKVLNHWGFESGLGITVFSKELEDPLNIVNIYGPCHNRGPYWDVVFNKSFLKEKHLILGGDLNFSLGIKEVWGSHARSDPLSTYFTQKLDEHNLLDIEPVKFKPTWRNNRVGEDNIAKRLDHFLIKDTLLEKSFQLKQWIGHGGISDHYPIFLELRTGLDKPPSPFKFNRTWLSDETFLKLVKENWQYYNPGSNETAGLHFVKNLHIIKEKTKTWAHQKLLKEDLELKELESKLNLISEDQGGGFDTTNAKLSLLKLEERRNRLLKEKEDTWRLKSRATWLKSGDENTKFFQAYAKGRRCINSIWQLKDQDGKKEHTFEGMAKIGKKFFQDLYKAENKATIEEVIRMVQYFPSFTSEEDNRMLMEKVTLEELKAVLNSFQKDKSPGPDGWTIEFFLGFFDSIGQDILSLVEETRLTGQMPLSLNSTFIALIPKKDNPDTLDDFRPISLCNCIYKIISKVIARRLKTVLSDKISLEQFGFLEGRQIHEAIGVAQEALHNIKTRKLKSVVLKIDLSKAYDRVSWLYLRLLLTHLGFTVPFIRWIMCCITTVTFSVLINGSATDFFRSERGLRQGCPLSPLLFLLVVEGLSRALAAEK
jgi:hypothetical protein